jgi:hypothetical protein
MRRFLDRKKWYTVKPLLDLVVHPTGFAHMSNRPLSAGLISGQQAPLQMDIGPEIIPDNDVKWQLEECMAWYGLVTHQSRKVLKSPKFREDVVPYSTEENAACEQQLIMFARMVDVIHKNNLKVEMVRLSEDVDDHQAMAPPSGYW